MGRTRHGLGAVTLGPVQLATPLVAASGTVGSVYEFTEVTDLSLYGAAVAKSVSKEPWEGRPHPRIAPAGVGMLNSIGIQNPGIEAWIDRVVPRLGDVPCPVWGSAVGRTVEDFADVAMAMAGAGIPVVEINLSCPNLDGHLFSLDPDSSRAVVAAVRNAIDIPIGAKLTSSADRVVEVAEAVAEAGADWVVVGNTIPALAIDAVTGRPSLSAGSGGYSGIPIKPIALRAVREITTRLQHVPVLGLGGVACGEDVVEYVRAGASAVGVGTLHFAEPRGAKRLTREASRVVRRAGFEDLATMRGVMEPW